MEKWGRTRCECLRKGARTGFEEVQTMRKSPKQKPPPRLAKGHRLVCGPHSSRGLGRCLRYAALGGTGPICAATGGTRVPGRCVPCHLLSERHAPRCYSHSIQLPKVVTQRALTSSSHPGIGSSSAIFPSSTPVFPLLLSPLPFLLPSSLSPCTKYWRDPKTPE